MARETGRIVAWVMGMRAENLPVPGSEIMGVAGICPAAAMFKTAVVAELAKTLTNPVPTAGRL